MSRFECQYEPYACDCSEFFEWQKSGHERILRWIECTDYRPDSTGEASKGVSGNLCLNNPSNWWESYLTALKKSE